MRLVRQTRLHFKEGNSDKIYEVDLCEIGGGFTVNFRYGRRGGDLKEGSKTVAPVSQAEAEKIFQKLIDEKMRKGYHAAGQTSETAAEKPKVVFSGQTDETARNQAIAAKLADPNAKSNPKIDRLIWRAGFLRIKEAAAPIANLIGTQSVLRDYCCAWALGECADENYFSAAEKLLSHESEAVRRIAFEACLKLAPDAKKLIDAKIAELPENYRRFYENKDAENLAESLKISIAEHKSGSFDMLEKLYVIGGENFRAVLTKTIGEIPLKPKFFKTVRHIFKIAEYRRDAEVFGVLARRFEVENSNFASYFNHEWKQINNKWERVERGNGLTSADSNFAFGNETKKYLTRRTWRTLRKSGEIGDAEIYVKMAVGALLAYTDADAQPRRESTRYLYRDENGVYDWRNPRIVKTVYDEFAPYLLLNHIIRGGSENYELKTGSKAFSLKRDVGDRKTSFREESFPQLWEKQPVGLLHLLSESRCEPVHEFAVMILRDCREFLAGLDLAAILMLLRSRYAVTAELGFELAESLYDAANPNIELLTAVAVCGSENARSKAFGWIDAHRKLFAADADAMFRLLTGEYSDTRRFAAEILRAANYSEVQAQTLIGRILAQMLAFGENEGEKAGDLGRAMLDVFGGRLKTLNLSVINDLLAHKLVEVQEFGGNILLIHETPTENLPGELINSLIESPFEPIRAVGIKLFGQFSDENLLTRDDVFFAFLSHELEDVYQSIRPIIRRLSGKNPQFADVLTRRLIIALAQKEERENLHSRFLTVLKEDLPDWTKYVDADLARILVSSRFPNTAEAGGIVLQNHQDEWARDFSTEELVAFSNNEVLAVRQTAWSFAGKSKDRFSARENPDFYPEVQFLIKALDSKWDDSREFWFGFFDQNLTERELSPEIVTAICDSVREDVQKFGREMLLKFFKAEDGAEYMLKLSEHPSAKMQLFVTNYLETYAAGSVENFEKLAPFFVRALSAVNRGRIVKTRILNFLETESLKSAESARIAAQILARQSATAAVGDRARTVETMLKIRRLYPEIELPIKVKEAELRKSINS